MVNLIFDFFFVSSC